MREQLLEQLESKRQEIIANSINAEKNEELIKDILSIKAQLDVIPIELNVGKKIDEWKEDTFSIIKTDRGALYNEHGHFSIFVDDNYGLCYFLNDIVENQEMLRNLSGDEQETFELNLSALVHCLSIPKVIAVDNQFMLKAATLMVDYLKEMQDKMTGMPLQEETVKEDLEFERAVKSMEEIKNNINKEL